MISKRITGRKDGKSSAVDAMKYGAGLKIDRKTGKYLDKSHRTRLGGFGLVDNGVYFNQNTAVMLETIELAGLEMQTNCNLNTRVGEDKKLAHFVVSFHQDKPSEAILRDVEDSMLSALKLDKNHFATFLHNDNCYWHLHLFVSRIEKGEPHKGNSLWHDKINRDKVCREVETRHGLQRDNGLHQVNEQGQIVEIPRAERQAMRDAKQTGISNRAKKTETYSGEKSFQSWANEIHIGDRLKHAKNWQDLHAAAAAYGCEVKQKGAGFVICPLLEKGSIQLSKIGLKNLPAKFGAFEFAEPCRHEQPENTYKPTPTVAKATCLFDKWHIAKDAFKPIKTAKLYELRKEYLQVRMDLRTQQTIELQRIRTEMRGAERFSAASIAKMAHAVALTAIAESFTNARQALRDLLDKQNPGNTFRDYLVQEAANGDDEALELAQRCGANEATDALCKREADQLKIVATITGAEYRFALRINYSFSVGRNGTVVYDFGQGRTIADSSIAKQVLLNAAAASDPEAIAIALRFATSKFGNTLTLTGSKEFQLLAVETAVRNGLFIKFADPALEQYRKDISAKAFNSHTPKEKQHVEHTQKHSDQRKPPAHRRNRLHHLSEFNLVSESASYQVLLQSDVPDCLGKRDGGRTQGQHSELRRDEYDRPEAARSRANQHSESIPGIATSTAVGAGLRPIVADYERANGINCAELHPDPRVMADIATQQDNKMSAIASAKRVADPNYTPSIPELKAIDQVLIQQARERLTKSNKTSSKGISESAMPIQTPDGYEPPTPLQGCGGNEPWALVSIDGEDWVAHKSSRSKWTAHRLADFKNEQQEAIRAASANGQAIKFKTEKDGKPSSESLEIWQELTRDISKKVER